MNTRPIETCDHSSDHAAHHHSPDGEIVSHRRGWEPDTCKCSACAVGAQLYAHPAPLARRWWESLTDDQRIDTAAGAGAVPLPVHPPAAVTPNRDDGVPMCTCGHPRSDHGNGVHRACFAIAPPKSSTVFCPCNGFEVAR